MASQVLRPTQAATSCGCSQAVVSPSRGCKNATAACAKGCLYCPGLTIRTWPNGAFAGIFEQTILPALTGASLKWQGDAVFSAELLGTLTLPRAASSEERWLIDCEGSGGSYFVWLEDHLVCEGGNSQPRWNPYRLEPVVPFGHTRHAASFNADAPVRYFLRATFVRLRTHILAAPDATPSLELRWQRAAAPPTYVWGKNKWQPPAGSAPAEDVPRSALSTFVPPEQHARLTLQRELLHGYWGTWSERSVTSHSLLPFGVEVRLGLCSLPPMRGRRAACDLEGTKAMVDDGRIRLGTHAVDRSYTQLFMMAHGINISVETAQRGRWGAFFVLARIVGGDALAARAAFVVSVGFAGSDGALPTGWELPGTVHERRASGSGRNLALTAESDGSWRRQANGPVTELGGMTVRAALGLNSTAEHFSAIGSGSPRHLAFRLGGRTHAIGIWASRVARGERSLAQVMAAVNGARREEEARALRGRGATPSTVAGDGGGDKSSGRRLSEVGAISQSAVMWNSLSRMSLPGPHTQCARGWGRPWVAFMWDDVFASMQLAAGRAPLSRALAYSQITTLLKGRLTDGMIPNMWMPNWISFDRSGPPLAALGVRLLHARYNDDWLVHLLYDDAAAWINWFWRTRRLAPLQLVALGSDAGAMASRYNVPSLRMAMLESGMDNSPMYDGATFDNRTHLMRLYDVGMSSMLVSELRHLAHLARSPSIWAHETAAAREQKQREAREHERRASEMGRLISAQMWNDPLGAFTNVHANGTHSTRVSPTSFYPMLARVATDRQAVRMVREWLVNPRRFCVRADAEVGGADEASSSEACHWGLPSISFDDPAFGEQDYWRGLVWPPNALLVYLGLHNYGHLPPVRAAKHVLVEQMRGLLLTQWHRHHHVCENYSPMRDAPNCTGDRFHQWGGLTGLISLIEAGELLVPTVEPLVTADGADGASTPAAASAAGGAAAADQAPREAILAAAGATQASARTPARDVASAPAAAASEPVGAPSGRWRVWRRTGGGWWGWRVPWRKLPGFAAMSSTALAQGHSPDIKARGGYAQAEAARAAAEHEERQLEGWLSFAVRHMMGSFGSHGLVELDLDHPNEL